MPNQKTKQNNNNKKKVLSLISCKHEVFKPLMNCRVSQMDCTAHEDEMSDVEANKPDQSILFYTGRSRREGQNSTCEESAFTVTR